MLKPVQRSFLTADRDSWLAWLFLQTFYLRLTPPLSYCASATVLINHTPRRVQHGGFLCACVRVGGGTCSRSGCHDCTSLHVNFNSKLSLTRKSVVSDDSAPALILGCSHLPECRIIQSSRGSSSVQAHTVAEGANRRVIMLPDMFSKEENGTL